MDPYSSGCFAWGVTTLKVQVSAGKVRPHPPPPPIPIPIPIPIHPTPPPWAYMSENRWMVGMLLFVRTPPAKSNRTTVRAQRKRGASLLCCDSLCGGQRHSPSSQVTFFGSSLAPALPRPPSPPHRCTSLWRCAVASA